MGCVSGMEETTSKALHAVTFSKARATGEEAQKQGRTSNPNFHITNPQIT